MVKSDVPVDVGLPEMYPLLADKVSPSGSAPETTVQLNGFVPPVIVS
jgi:hypothetical protein